MQYCYVRCLKGYHDLLLYLVPQDYVGLLTVGTLVLVPLQRREVFAVVISVVHELAEPVGFKIRSLRRVIFVPSDDRFDRFIHRVAEVYLTESLMVFERAYRSLHDVPEPLDELDMLSAASAGQVVHLTDEQQLIVDALGPVVEQGGYRPALLHGVTGSGKTEVYKKLILRAHQVGKSSLLLLPEVSLAEQFFHILSAQLTQIEIFRFHSATQRVERDRLWQALCDRRPILVIGVHMPVFLPFDNLGIIIIDEEHEAGFTEKKHPKFNSKEVALLRAHMYQIPIVMGSATPSVTSLYNVEHRGWQLFEMTKRFSGAFPRIVKVSLLDRGVKRRRSFWITPRLEDAIRETLARGHQVILYINRRGFSFFVQCSSCGHARGCDACSVTLTYHKLDDGREVLRCHYCNYQEIFTSWCFACRATKDFLKKGIGTQQVVSIIASLFPHARIGRADLDTTVHKKKWRATVAAFERGDLDILIGTQTLTKGYHFPGVTLVGVLWADLSLNFPVYNASEITLQQLIQVAGRAGRYHDESLVIIQTMVDHSVFNYIDEYKYREFCHQELSVRYELGYPPAQRMAMIEVRHKDADLVDDQAQRLASDLYAIMQKYDLQGLAIRGPAIPVVYKIQRYEFRHIFIKSSSFRTIKQLIDELDRTSYSVDILISMVHS